MLWEEILQPNVVPAFMAVQVARVLKDLCYKVLCHLRGGVTDKLEPAHRSLPCQHWDANRQTDRQQADRRPDRRTDRQTGSS